jgi:hypothetical protein
MSRSLRRPAKGRRAEMEMRVIAKAAAGEIMKSIIVLEAIIHCMAYRKTMASPREKPMGKSF